MLVVCDETKWAGVNAYLGFSAIAISMVIQQIPLLPGAVEVVIGRPAELE